MYLNDKLYLRSESLKPKPFVQINPVSLEEEEKVEFDLEKEDKNLEWKTNEETGRSLTYTPMITEGTYIYVISQRKAPKPKCKNHHHLFDLNYLIIEEGSEEKPKEDDKPPMLVVEVYDPSDPYFKLVKETPLYKNEQFDPFIKSSNSVDFLKDSSFATNGQALVIQTHKMVYYFDLKTGVRVQKIKTSDNGLTIQDCKMVYDYHNNLFYSFKYNTSATKMEAFTVTNFKKDSVSAGFAKDFLAKRINHFKALVYGENPAVEAKQKPQQMNLIQRIMKNVTTPVLIN